MSHFYLENIEVLECGASNGSAAKLAADFDNQSFITDP